MIVNEKTIDKFISNSFEIDCIDIRLTQKKNKDPIVYTGPGTIYQDEHGILQLKLYSKLSDADKEIPHHFKHHKPGKIIPNDYFFTLKATDMSGNEWLADNIWISVNVSSTLTNVIIKSKLDEIKTIELKEARANAEKNYLHIIIPGQYKIPCNEKESLSNGGWRLNRAVFSTNEINFEFKKYDGYLIIYAYAKTQYLDKNVYLKLIEALSIITGFTVRPMVITSTKKDKEISEIRSVDNSFSNKELSPPFKHFSTTEFESFIGFIGKYLTNIKYPFSDLFGFWLKINRAWQSSVMYSDLAIAVSVEGIVNTYFMDKWAPDKKRIKSAELAKRLIEGCGLDLDIRNYLLSSAGRFGLATSKNILYKLVESNNIEKRLVDQWDKLRNKAVHPINFENDPVKKQKYIDLIFASLVLFYQLIFIMIKYEGKYIDYTEKNWPEKEFNLKKE